VNAADQAFVHAMSTTTTVAAAVALLGAVVALAFLPSRARPEKAVMNEEVLELAAA
jgi:DHA2 family multidrug resistance protein-like MFS transporter